MKKAKTSDIPIRYLKCCASNEIIMNFYKISKQDFKEWVSMNLALWPHYNKKKKRLEQIFNGILKSPKQMAFLCKNDNNEPVAFINISLRTDYVEGSTASPVGYVEGIYVKPEYRKQGVAKELVKLAEKWAKNYGCKELGSDTELGNINGQKFHKNLGFKEANKIVHFIKKIK